MKKKQSWSFLKEETEKVWRIMRLTMIFSFCFAMAVSAAGYSQNARLNVDFQNITLRQVFEYVEQNSQFIFLYKNEDLNVDKKININLQNATIDEILEKVLEGQDVTYRILDRQVILTKTGVNPQNVNLFQAAKEVRGQVTGQDGLPIPGVSVVVKGTSSGTITDMEGRFSLASVSPDATLVFSFVGMRTQEIAVDGRTSIQVRMEDETIGLEEVIAIGYGVQRKKDLTTSVASVTSEDFAERPITQIGQAMAGLAAGVQVTETSGKPGSGLSIRVRGATSLNANNDPLFVIDGIPTNDTRGLAVEDIESMQVLKDASAAAIYGSRGANGVVLITTKRGKTGTAKMTLSTYQGFAELPKKIGVLNGQQYAELINESQINAGGSPRYDNPSSVQDVTDWQDEVYRTAPVSNYQLSFSGGSEKTQYYLALSLLNQKGIIDPTQFKRYSIKLNIDQQIYDWLKVGSSINWSKTDSHDVTDNNSVARGGVVLGALSTPPTIPVYNDDGTFSVNPFQAWENPVAAMKGTDEGTKSNQLLANFFGEVKLIKELVFKSSLGFESNNSTWGSFVDPYRTGSGRAYKGIGRNTTNIDFTWLNENTLTYTGSLAGGHRFSALAGFTTQRFEWNGTDQEVRNFASDRIPTLNGGSISVTNSTDATEWTMVSLIGRVTYDYQGKYLLTANIRHDASSRFGKENRWGTYPSVSAGWRISDENFMEGTRHVINDMKLRVSWGMNGNQPEDPYAPQGKVSPSGGYPFGEMLLPGVAQTRATNDSLKWETTRQINAGIDVSLYDSRVQVSADVYYKKTKDLLMDVSVATQMGVANQLRNVGNVDNKGFELSVSSRNLTGALKWNTDLNFSINRNKVKNLGGEEVLLFSGNIYERGDVSIVREGYPIGSFYGLIAKGVDPQTGMMIYEDQTNDGEYNDADRVVIGDAQPDFIFGLNNTLSYKNFTLGFLFQGVQGNDIFNASRIEIEGMENWKNQSTEVLRRWKNPGDMTDVPKALADNKDNSMLSTRFLEDGSFIRLKSVTLSYNLKSAWLQSMQISNVQLYFTGQNLWTITDYSGYDPELNYGGTSNTALGIDFGTFPQPRTFIFGVNIDF
ncbi:MAG: TonB-dependent receptor [Mangrovibacterium sp.]